MIDYTNLYKELKIYNNQKIISIREALEQIKESKIRNDKKEIILEILKTIKIINENETHIFIKQKLEMNYFDNNLFNYYQNKDKFKGISLRTLILTPIEDLEFFLWELEDCF